MSQVADILETCADAIEQTHADGTIVTRAGDLRSIRDFAIPRPCGALLERAVVATFDSEPKNTSAPHVVEIGLGSGLATLHLARGLLRCGISAPGAIRNADPGDYLDGAGELLLERADVADLVDLRREYSHTMLADLEREEHAVRFAFIDGAHLFDTALVDAFLVDKLLPVGGVIALHDLWMPALQTLALFLTTNRAYEPVTVTANEQLVAGPCESEKRGVDPDRVVSTRFKRDLLSYVDWHTLLLRKTEHESRAWDHFAPFWE